jgi:hypothetical protein
VILRRCAPVLVGLAVLAFPAAAGARPAQAPTKDPPKTATKPVVSVTPPDAAPGTLVVLTLEHWPAGTVTLSLCGNAARRGSPDCDQIGAGAADIAKQGSTIAELALTTPPVPCTCVIRVSTQDNSLVRTVPINLLGVPNGPDIPAGGPSTQALSVHADVVDGTTSAPASWLPVFAGPVHRQLVLQLRNRSEQPMTGLRVSATVGRDGDAGTPLGGRAVPEIEPGETRTVSVPVTIDAPTWGDYEIRGRVSGADASVPFRSTTSNDPWGLELLLPLALIVVARVLRRRERARDRALEVSSTAPSTWPPAEIDLLQDCSPEVGADDGKRSPAPVYDPIDAVWTAPTPDVGQPEALVTSASTTNP